MANPNANHPPSMSHLPVIGLKCVNSVPSAIPSIPHYLYVESQLVRAFVDVGLELGNDFLAFLALEEVVESAL